MITRHSHCLPQADFLRAARRKGMDPNQVSNYRGMATDAMRDDQQHREQLAKEAAARAIYDARMAREEASRAAAAERRRDAERGLRALLDAELASLKAAVDDVNEEGARGGVSFRLSPSETKCRVILRDDDDDGSDAAARFCAGFPPAPGYSCSTEHLVNVAKELTPGPVDRAHGEAPELKDAAAASEARGDDLGSKRVLPLSPSNSGVV